MLTIKSFGNSDISDWLSVWTDQAERFPDFLAPVTRQVMETQILGNCLFDPKGLLIARFNGEPVGFIHAAFAPNRSGTDASKDVGILYAPIVRDAPIPRGEIARALIDAGETYFLSHKTRRWYAGGYANSSPFYTGLYGRTNPDGICEKDTEILNVFHQLNYSPFSSSRRFRLVCAPFRANITPKIQQAHRSTLINRFTRSTEETWWDANIFRNFDSEEWNAFTRDSRDDEPIAGVLFRRMASTYSARGELEQREVRYILDYIGVVETSLRQGIASLLLTAALIDLGKYTHSFTVDTVVDSGDTRLAEFLLANKFKELDSVCSFYKVLA